jgi:phage terminase small subunit
VPKLSNKQQAFIAQYLVDSNATQAAIRAGYSKKTAYTIGAENLRKPQIRDAIAKARAPVLEKARITGARVLEELAAIAFVRLGDYVNERGELEIVRLAREQPAAIAELTAEVLDIEVARKRKTTTIKRRVKVHDKNEALRDLGRHFKLFATDVAPRDVPKTDLPMAPPRKIHEYTTEELRAIVQKGTTASASTGSRRAKR